MRKKTHKIRVECDLGVITAAEFLHSWLRCLGHVGGPRLLEFLLGLFACRCHGEFSGEDIAQFGAVAIATARNLSKILMLCEKITWIVLCRRILT